jgi:hypothetical protein
VDDQCVDDMLRVSLCELGSMRGLCRGVLGGCANGYNMVLPGRRAPRPEGQGNLLFSKHTRNAYTHTLHELSSFPNFTRV